MENKKISSNEDLSQFDLKKTRYFLTCHFRPFHSVHAVSKEISGALGARQHNKFPIFKNTNKKLSNEKNQLVWKLRSGTGFLSIVTLIKKVKVQVYETLVEYFLESDVYFAWSYN